MNISQWIDLVGTGTLETLYIVLVSTLVTYIFAIPIGVILYVTDKNGILECNSVNMVLGTIVNIGRSIPFILLMVYMLPVTRALIGTTVGPTAVIPSLIASAVPFVARMIESSLKEIDYGVIEAAQAMGSTPFQIIYKVLLVEARPSILVGLTIVLGTMIGYSAMAGMIGGGGLGAIAINYGYYRYQSDVMTVVIVVIVILVQIMQIVGMGIARKNDKRIR